MARKSRAKERRRGRWIDLACLALFAAAALWLSRPWILHPLASSIGFVDPLSGLESIDGVSNMTFGGWWNFALFRLRAWPLAHTRYLMFPYGAAPGASFDSMLSAAAMGLLSAAMPLHLAYNLVILSAFVLVGWFAYRFSARRWGRGWIALVVGLSAECIPYLVQRAPGHTNLLPVWTLWVLMHLAENLREKPTPKRAAAFGAAFPLMAAASWYILIMGLVYAACAGAAMVLAALFKKSGCRSRTLAHLAGGLALGGACVLILASPMLGSYEGRRKPEPKDLAPYSTPLIQYALPYPGSLASSLPAAARLQSEAKTNWEAFATLPAASFLFFLAAIFLARDLALRLALFAAFAFAVVYSLGPFLQISHALEPGKGETTPLYHLMKIKSAFGIFRAPGRMHVLAYFAALAGSACALAALREKYFSRGAAAKFLWPALNLAVLAGNILWLVPRGPMPLFENLRTPDFFRRIGAERGGAVFDVPFDYFEFPYYNYYQLAHGRPTVSSTLYHDAHQGRSLEFTRSSREMLFFSARNDGYRDEATLARAGSAEFMSYLARFGVEYVVVHDRTLNHAILHGHTPPETRAMYARIEEAWKDRLAHSEPGLRAYRTTDLPAPQP